MLNEKIKIFNLDKSYIVKYKENIINLMEDAHRISFPNQKINLRDITNRYESLIEYIEQNKGSVLGATQDDNLLGYLWYFITNEGRIHINQIVLKEETRGQGIGSKLINQLDTVAKSIGAREIELNVSMVNEKAIKFYKKQNFVVERIQMKRDILG